MENNTQRTITAEEHESLKDFRSKLDMMVLQLGQLTASRVSTKAELDSIDAQLDLLQRDYLLLTNTVSTFYNELYKKYGNVDIDINSGAVLE